MSRVRLTSSVVITVVYTILFHVAAMPKVWCEFQNIKNHFRQFNRILMPFLCFFFSSIQIRFIYIEKTLTFASIFALCFYITFHSFCIFVTIVLSLNFIVCSFILFCFVLSCLNVNRHCFLFVLLLDLKLHVHLRA